MNRVLRKCGAVAGLTALLTVPMGAAESPLTFRVHTVKPTAACLDTVAQARAHVNRIRTLAATPGRALAYDQVPAIVSPSYGGTIQLSEFMVAGDVPSLTFRVVDGATETWTRQRTDTLAGSPVSVFQPSWDSSILDRAMANARWGWDAPELYIGDVLGAGDAGGERQILLRIGPDSLPAVPVTQAAGDVQYSSHVVNIVLPGFSDEIVQVDDPTTELTRVTQRFYQVFQDSYDAIAVVPQRSLLMPYSGVHYTVKSDVAGINQEQYDHSGDYGSASGRLHGLEMFPQFFPDNHISTHEASHQWGMYADWTALAGLTRTGHQTGAHDPAWVGYPSRMSSVLDGVRTVVDQGGSYVVAKSAAPILFPPMLRYAMGLLPKASVPDTVLVDDQSQFSLANVPAPGTPVSGGVRGVSINAVASLHGERSGPVPAEWSRATIVVSRGGLLSQREMDYWTYYAQRNEDPNRSGTVDFEGYGSFDRATDNAVDFKTDIRPLSGAAISAPLPVDYPNFTGTDLRGITLTTPLATLQAAGSPMTVAGRVNSVNPAYNRVAFCLGQEDQDGCGTDPTIASIGGDGSFTARVVPPTPGRYQLLYFLVPTAGGSFAALWQVSNFTVN